MWLTSATINFMAMLVCGITTIHSICNGHEGIAIFNFVLLLISTVCLICSISRWS